MSAAPKISHGSPRVCIVSNEFIGLSRNGGIGTAVTGLAYTLAHAGLPVTVLFTDGITVPKSELLRAQAHYARHGIVLEILGPRELRVFTGPIAGAGYAMPAAIFEALRRREFDVIHFNDTGGYGHYCLVAKRLGLAFADTLLAVGVHSPMRWVDSLNGSVPESMLALCFDQAEHASIACADLLWGPSRYLLDWLAANGFHLAKQTLVQQYVLPPLPVTAGAQRSQAVREIVFFGRLEERKGLRIFCEAVSRIEATLHARAIGVSFMGRTMPIDGINSRHWIEERSRNWRLTVNIMTDRDQPAALSYLNAGGRLAIMASPADNSPCTVYEAIIAGIPFLAAATGGIPELIHEADRDLVLFDYDAAKLAAQLAEAIDRPAVAVRPAVGDIENGKRWVEIHKHWHDYLAVTRRDGSETPAFLPVSVVVFGANRSESLAATLASLAPFSHKVARVLVIGRAARAHNAVPPLAFKSADETQARAALRELVEQVDAPVLFVKAGVRAIGDQLAAHLRGLAGSRLDGLIPAGRRVDGRLIVGLGHGVAVAFHEGVLQTGGTIISRAAVVRGLTDARPEGEAILALHDAIVLSDAEIGASPLPVFEDVGNNGLRPSISFGRAEFYAERAPRADLQALISMAASVERDDGLGSLARRFGTKIVVSRWGSTVAPLMARAWRSYRARAKSN